MNLICALYHRSLSRSYSRAMKHFKCHCHVQKGKKLFHNADNYVREIDWSWYSKGCKSLTNSENIDPDVPSLCGKNYIHGFQDAGQSIAAGENIRWAGINKGSLNSKCAACWRQVTWEFALKCVLSASSACFHRLICLDKWLSQCEWSPSAWH